MDGQIYGEIAIGAGKAAWAPTDSQLMYDSFARFIAFTTLGIHHLDLEVQIDIRDSYGVPAIHCERRTFSINLKEIEPPAILKFVRLFHDPKHEAGHYLSTGQLQAVIWRAPLPLKELALTEIIRRDRLGELTAVEQSALIELLLDIQGDRTRPWSGEFGDYLESLRAANRFSDANWHRYGRQQLVTFFALERKSQKDSHCR